MRGRPPYRRQALPRCASAGAASAVQRPPVQLRLRCGFGRSSGGAAASAVPALPRLPPGRWRSPVRQPGGWCSAGAPPICRARAQLGEQIAGGSWPRSCKTGASSAAACNRIDAVRKVVRIVSEPRPSGRDGWRRRFRGRGGCRRRRCRSSRRRGRCSRGGAAAERESRRRERPLFPRPHGRRHRSCNRSGVTPAPSDDRGIGINGDEATKPRKPSRSGHAK